MQNYQLKITVSSRLITFVRMQLLRRILNFYINASLHVALSVYALIRMTFHFFTISYDEPMISFSFFGTIVGYNFVKYEGLIRTEKVRWNRQLKGIVVLSAGSFTAATYYFFSLEPRTQLTALGFFALTLLYTLPVFPKFGNARNWAGIKIYIVAFCWAGITLFLPILNAGLPLSHDVWLEFCQRFLLIIILILIFEIIDLKNDDLSLQTVPQKLGVLKTKMLNLFLLLPFYFLEFFKSDFQIQYLWINLVLVVVIALFTVFSSPKRSNYYTDFWVESVPVFWWLMVVLTD